MIYRKLPILLVACALGLSFRASAYEAPEGLYQYLGTVDRVVDGNTLKVDVDLGFGVWMHKADIRLKGVQVPQVEGATAQEGAAAFKFLKEKLDGQERILLKTSPDPSGEFDGFLAEISIWDEDKAAWVPINQMVIEAGHGKASN